MRTRSTVVIAIMVAVLAALPAYAFAGATDDVKKTVDEVVRIVSDKEMKKPQTLQKRRAALKGAIGRIFDYTEMTKRAMGTNWKERTPAEKKELTTLFSTLLENSYAGKIESYENEKIVYLKELVDGDFAEVKSKVVSQKRGEFTLDYRLQKVNGAWAVYDVVIEGVSLVSNYRTQFSNILKTQGYQGLVKKLRSKSGDTQLN